MQIKGKRQAAIGQKRTLAFKEKPRRSGVFHQSMSIAKQKASPNYGVTSSTQLSMTPMLQPNLLCPLPRPWASMICSHEHPAVSVVL